MSGELVFVVFRVGYNGPVLRVVCSTEKTAKAAVRRLGKGDHWIDEYLMDEVPE